MFTWTQVSKFSHSTRSHKDTAIKKDTIIPNSVQLPVLTVVSAKHNKTAKNKRQEVDRKGWTLQNWQSVWPSKNLTLLHVHVATGAWEEPSAKSCPKIAFKFSQYLFLDKLKKIFERQTRTQHVHYSRPVPTVSHKHGYFDTSNSHDDLWTMSKTCPFYVLNLKLYSQ